MNYENEEVSIIFGNEQSGLSNDEIQLCNYIATIPTDHAYTSLNLAAAVQIFSYEYFKNINKNDSKKIKKDTQHVSHSNKESFDINFLINNDSLKHHFR